jgi:hypothetical protein
MLRRISVLLLSALLTVGLTPSVAMGATVTPPDQEKIHDDKGQPNADEPKEPGGPDDPNSWGSVAAQLADEGVMGAHSSDPVPTGCFGENKELNCRETPRDGLGNVAKNDFDDHGVPTTNCDQIPEGETPCDTGDNLSDHGCIAAAAPLPGFPEVQPDCTLDPQEVHG